MMMQPDQQQMKLQQEEITIGQPVQLQMVAEQNGQPQIIHECNKDEKQDTARY